MFLPFIVILPGIAALALSKMDVGYALPLKADGGPDYDQVLTTLMAQFYPAGMLGVGLTGLMASFMSGMAGNVTAFNTVWTYDIYQSYIRPGAPDRHYLTVGRVTTVVGVLLSIAAAYLAHAATTTSWTCCNWSSASSTRRCSPPSCWACSGSAPPATALSPG